MMQIKRYHIGDNVRVHQDQSHRLPLGLPDGAEVKVVGAIYDVRLVECQGEIFEVDTTNIDGGAVPPGSDGAPNRT